MATKADFTDAQWQELVFAIEDTMTYVALSNGPKFFESFKEVGAAAHFMADQSKTSTSTLVRDLAQGGYTKRDKSLTADPTNMESSALDRVAAASKVVADVAPDELPAFKTFLLGVADAAAEVNGVDERETAALDKIKDALE